MPRSVASNLRAKRRAETTARLRDQVNVALASGNRKAAEFWQEVFSDHIRNQHRTARGMDICIARWNRDLPEPLIELEAA